MPSPVSRKFAEWTHGLNTRERMVSIFEHIRDIPFGIPALSGFYDPARAPGLLLERGCGSCAAKHYLLSEMYRKLDLNVIFATFRFQWDDQALPFPPVLRQLAARMPVAYHLACRVQAGCRWVLVDATWDLPLQAAGFPVNVHWDGGAEMRCAVRPLESPLRPAFHPAPAGGPCREGGGAEPVSVDGEKDHWEAEDQVRYLEERMRVRTRYEIEGATGFYRTFNRWLEHVRTAGGR
jgi:hypothetical protein